MKLRYEKTMASYVFKEPTRKIQENYIQIDQKVKQLINLIQTRQEKEKIKYTKMMAQLDAYSPLKTLARGYTITQKEGRVVKKVTDLKIADRVKIRFQDGQVEAEVKRQESF